MTENSIIVQDTSTAVRPPAGGADRSGAASRSSPIPDLMSLAMHRKGTVLAVGLIGALAGLAAGMLLPATFKANAKLLVDPRELRVLDKQLTPSNDVQSIATTLVETQAQVLGSDNVLKEAARRLSLRNDPEFNGSDRNILGRWRAAAQSVLSRSGRASATDDTDGIVLETLQRNVKVRRQERAYVIDLSATARSRGKAHKIVETILGAYLDDQTAARSELARRAMEDIDARTEPLRRAVLEFEEKILRYKIANDLVGVRGQNITEQQLADINAQLGNLRIESARLKSRLDSLPRSTAEIDRLPEAMTSTTLRDLRVSMTRIAQEKATLGAQLLPNHPVMRGISDNERQLHSMIGAEMARIREAVSIEYKRAREAERAVEQQLEQLRGSFNSASRRMVELHEMERELEARRNVYSQALNRTREIREQEGLNTLNLRIISPPMTEQHRVSPPPSALLAVVGFVMAALAALLSMHARRALKLTA